MDVVTPKVETGADATWDFSTGLQLTTEDTLQVRVMRQSDCACVGMREVGCKELATGLSGRFALEGGAAGAWIELDIVAPEEGLVDGSRLLRHPLAHGVDKHQVRVFEVGKQYLLVPPEKQALVYQQLGGPQELESYLEALFRLLGRLTNPMSIVKEAVAPQLRQGLRNSKKLLMSRRHRGELGYSKLGQV